jgi:hypothetical protein
MTQDDRHLNTVKQCLESRLKATLSPRISIINCPGTEAHRQSEIPSHVFRIPEKLLLITRQRTDWYQANFYLSGGVNRHNLLI